MKEHWAYGAAECWSYDRKVRKDSDGQRWHFVMRSFYDKSIAYDEQPYELLFRDDERKEFGRIHFERRKDNPYRDYEALVRKIITDLEFRRKMHDPSFRKLWQRTCLERCFSCSFTRARGAI